MRELPTLGPYDKHLHECLSNIFELPILLLFVVSVIIRSNPSFIPAEIGYCCIVRMSSNGVCEEHATHILEPSVTLSNHLG